MGIKNFRKLEKLKPHVEVKIGGLCPTGCKNPVLYHESDPERPCMNKKDGECQFVSQKGQFWGKQALCPNRGKTLDKCKSRPFQLGYFDIPEQQRVALGLPDRPTEIPGIILMSQHDFSSSLNEPLECLYEYPVLDYFLAWWTKTSLVCKGDGETATMYPANPENEQHMQPRKCMYKECKDFQDKGKCKEILELYFRLPKAPGFPAMWRIMSRSRKVIQYLLSEIEQLHTLLNGRVSFVPLTLTLEPEKGRPIVEGKRMTTDVFRLHLRTAFTMNDVIGHIEDREKFLNGGDMKMLEASTSDIKPESAAPVEMDATADEKDWNEDDVVDVPREDAKKPAESAAKAANGQPAAQGPPEVTDEQVHAEAAKLELVMIDEINKAPTLELARDLAGQVKWGATYRGYKPEKLKKAYYQRKEALTNQLQEQAEQPVVDVPTEQEPPADNKESAPATPTHQTPALRQQVDNYLNAKPPVFSETQALDMYGFDSLDQFTDEDLKNLIGVIEEALKQ